MHTYILTCHNEAAAWISRSVPYTLSLAILLMWSSTGTGWLKALNCSLLCLQNVTNSRLTCWWLSSFPHMILDRARNKQLPSPWTALMPLWNLCKNYAPSVHSWRGTTCKKIQIYKYTCDTSSITGCVYTYLHDWVFTSAVICKANKKTYSIDVHDYLDWIKQKD